MKKPTLLAFRNYCAVLFCALLCSPCVSASMPQVFFPHQGIDKNQLAIVINQADPMSQRIGRYYQAARSIPKANIVFIDIPTDPKLSPFRFKKAMKILEEQLPDNIQALALTWNKPYQVGCMSATAAFSFGYNTDYCANSCKPTKANPYFNNSTSTPLQRFHFRPSMMLAGSDFASVKAMIDRGVESDHSNTVGEAWLMETSDSNRTVRQRRFGLAEQQLGYRLPVHIKQADTLRDKNNVMFYFTGLTHVAGITSNNYLPGAVADHLTSFGGRLTDSSQMSALKWIDAGLTGSYGAVTEPCNFLQKFPDPLIMISHYLAGETLIESYWKSVLWPGQGLFIGEPLARPYAGYQITRSEEGFIVTPPKLPAGLYHIEASNSQQGPYITVQNPIWVSQKTLRFTLLDRGYRFYRLRLDDGKTFATSLPLVMPLSAITPPTIPLQQ